MSHSIIQRTGFGSLGLGTTEVDVAELDLDIDLESRFK